MSNKRLLVSGVLTGWLILGVAVLSALSDESYRLHISDDTGLTDHEIAWEGEPVPESNGLIDEDCWTESQPNMWLKAQYLRWWTKGNDIPALVTTSPLGTMRDDAGVLGVPGTETLFGGHAIDNEDRPGLRLGGGVWLDDEHTVALEADYFSVFDDTGTGDFATQTQGVLGSGVGTPIIARPFFNTQMNAEDAQLISFPNVVDGTIGIASSSELHSGALLLRQNLRSGTRGRLDVVGGYRYLRYREALLISEHIVATDPMGLPVAGTTLDVTDRFSAENNFHGGDVGLVLALWREHCAIELMAKVAVGRLWHDVAVNGSTVITAPGGPAATSNQGLLALPTNSGVRQNSDFAVVPEFGVNMQVALRPTLHATVGYSLVMLTDAIRTGGQIDRAINPTQLTGPLVGEGRPMPLLSNQDDFWAQGLAIGLVWER